MINFIPYDKIDRRKYDDCIGHSRESRIYAFSWYLDCVCERWDALVEDDYLAVMPLPKGRKYGIDYVYTPSWVQQLGVFSLEEADHLQQEKFLRALSRKYVWIDYQFNAANKAMAPFSSLRKNYILPLDKCFDDLQRDFSNNRKRISKKSFADFHLDKQGDPELFFENYTRLEKPYALDESAIRRLRCLCSTDNGKVRIWNVFKDGVFMAGLVWLISAKRITYLVPLSDRKFKAYQLATFLLLELIRDFQGQQVVLDFEGSMVLGVERFYQSFGAKPETYYYFKKRWLRYD